MALAAERGSAEAWFNLGLTFERTEDYDEARFAFEQAYRGGIVAAVSNLARVLAKDGPAERAEALLAGAADAGDRQAQTNLDALRLARDVDSAINAIFAESEPYAEPVDLEPSRPGYVGTEAALALI
jgi:Flp pilus assembly protein TadD